MCFTIDEKAKQPKAKYAWKLVERTEDGYLRSLFYPDKKSTWQPGVEQRRRTGAQTWLISRAGDRIAHSGVYVYTSKKAARHASLCYPSGFMMRVHVAPGDWLFSSTYGTQATYTAVKPCEVQPEFDWI